MKDSRSEVTVSRASEEKHDDQSKAVPRALLDQLSYLCPSTVQ